jgi:hypothetical protein
MGSAAQPESGSPAVGQPGPDSSAAHPPGADPLATGPVTPQAGRARLLTWLAGTGIGASLLIMIAVSVVRDSWMYPPVAGPASGPPWDLRSGHVSAGTVTLLLWFATLAGAAGVAAGLAAVQRGARPSPRALLIGAAIAVAALTVLPPAGSTDVFDYAAYGRIAALGHSPYLMTPYHLRLAHDAFAPSVPAVWQHVVSVYGPLATLEQFLAAKLGGISVARVVFWLKLWNAIAFVVVAIVVDRLVRADPARRLRAHLLWTINPLLLWDIVAAGHLDVLAAAVGLAGLLVLGEQRDDQQRDLQGGRRGEPVSGAGAGLLRALAAGALIGIAADIKINYVLFGLGLAWALRRSPARLAAAAVAGLAALVAGYAWFGMPAVTVLADRRNRAVVDSFYRVFLINPHWRSQLALIATILVVATGLLALWRMPAGVQARPAIRPVLALSAAWLFLWPYQYPWYDVMIICLLVLCPASLLDWLVLARLAAGTIPGLPGNPPGIGWWASTGHLMTYLHHIIVFVLAPMVLFAAAAGLVWLCLSGPWKRRGPDDPSGPAAPEPTYAISR